jgi:hypothetical protein
MDTAQARHRLDELWQQEPSFSQPNRDHGGAMT